MEKMKNDGTVYRLPPDKKNPKGLRVWKSLDPADCDSVVGQLVATVKDGRMFFTKRELAKENRHYGRA